MTTYHIQLKSSSMGGHVSTNNPVPWEQTLHVVLGMAVVLLHGRFAIAPKKKNFLFDLDHNSMVVKNAAIATTQILHASFRQQRNWSPHKFRCRHVIPQMAQWLAT